MPTQGNRARKRHRTANPARHAAQTVASWPEIRGITRIVGIFGFGRTDQPAASAVRSEVTEGGHRRLEDNPMAITKTELVASIASATGQSQSAVSGVLDALFSTVSEAVAKGDKVTIPGWIAFEQVETSARTGRNPQTGAEIKIPAGKRVKVTAGSKLKAAVK
jgi:DNA-binding protein HU-beta